MRKWGWFFIGTLLSVVVLFLGACAPSTTSTPAPAAPPGWEEFNLERYPIIPVKRKMTDTELTKLELVRGKLEQPTFVFNHFRGLCPKGQTCGKWELFPAGTEVAVDRDGRPWYKTDCSNRLYVPVRNGPAWWPFGGGGPRWPWWLPWLLLLPLLGLLGYLVGRREGQLPPPPPGNGNGGGNGHGNGGGPDLPGPAAIRPTAATPASAPPAPPAAPVPAPVPVAPSPTSSLTLAEAQDLCLRHIKLERAGVRALYARWDAGKISDEEFLASVEAILAD